MSSSVASSSLVIRTSRNSPICTCGKPSSLRTSNTSRNPGRSFFGCPKHNTEELPHCNYFKWANSSEEREKKPVKIEIKLLRNEEEFRKREEEIVKRELGIHNDEVDVQKQ